MRTLKGIEKYSRPHCPVCGTRDTFHGTCYISYEDSILHTDMSCRNKHKWTESEKHEKMSKDGKVPPTTQSE